MGAGGSRRRAAPPLDGIRKDFRALKGRNESRSRIGAMILSPASRASNLLGGRDPRVTLAALAHPGLLSVAAARLIDADICIDSLPSWLSHFRRNPTNRWTGAMGIPTRRESSGIRL